MNDQIWKFNIEAKYITQYRKIYVRGKFKHQSSHDCIIFKINSQIKKESRFKLCFPEEDKKLNKFWDSVEH